MSCYETGDAECVSHLRARVLKVCVPWTARYNPETGDAEFVFIQRQDTGEWAS